jgi:hypothetical protein
MITPGRILETLHFTSANPKGRDFVAKLGTKIAIFSCQNYAIILKLLALIFIAPLRLVLSPLSEIRA